jgi:hypothetical protein
LNFSADKKRDIQIKRWFSQFYLSYPSHLFILDAHMLSLSHIIGRIEGRNSIMPPSRSIYLLGKRVNEKFKHFGALSESQRGKWGEIGGKI